MNVEIYKLEEDEDTDYEEKYIKESDTPQKEIVVDALKNLKDKDVSKYFIKLMKLPKKEK